MALSSVRHCISKNIISNKRLLVKSIPALFSADLKSTQIITRSLFFLSKNQAIYALNTVSSKISRPNNINCHCYVHTKGSEELAAFLQDEIENEKKSQGSKMPKLDEFECKLSGAEVELTKKVDGATIIIKANVNNSVDAEDTTMDPNDPKEPQEAAMKAKPEFRVEIVKGKKILSFLCTYSHDLPEEEEPEQYNDTFQISEITLYEGEYIDSTYTVSGDIIDGYLYDLLMNYLEERGITNDFADKMIAFFTAYEHQLYINLLQGMKSFVEKKNP